MAKARTLAGSTVALALLLALCALGAGPANARVPGVEIGRAWLVERPQGPASLLVAVRYPIQMSGRLVESRVELRRGDRVRTWLLHERPRAGALRLRERRRAFTFVHRLELAQMAASVPPPK